MGTTNQSGIRQDLNRYRLNNQQFIKYNQVSCNYPLLQIYQHINNNYEIMQYQYIINDQNDLKQIAKIFKKRYQHIYIVSSLFIYVTSANLCNQQSKIYIAYERIITNMSQIKDVPFISTLHFYAVALKGFQYLYQIYGFFQICQEMFHITQQCKLKVWCNRKIERNCPEANTFNSVGDQQSMLMRTLYLVNQNIDHDQEQMNIKNAILSQKPKNFTSAIYIFWKLCKNNGWQIPDRLKCLSDLKKEKFYNLFDIYAFKMKDNEQLKEIEKKRTEVATMTNNQWFYENGQNISIVVRGTNEDNQKSQRSMAFSKIEKNKIPEKNRVNAVNNNNLHNEINASNTRLIKNNNLRYHSQNKNNKIPSKVTINEYNNRVQPRNIIKINSPQPHQRPVINFQQPIIYHNQPIVKYNSNVNMNRSPVNYRSSSVNKYQPTLSINYHSPVNFGPNINFPINNNRNENINKFIKINNNPTKLKKKKPQNIINLHNRVNNNDQNNKNKVQLKQYLQYQYNNNEKKIYNFQENNNSTIKIQNYQKDLLLSQINKNEIKSHYRPKFIQNWIPEKNQTTNCKKINKILVDQLPIYQSQPSDRINSSEVLSVKGKKNIQGLEIKNKNYQTSQIMDLYSRNNHKRIQENNKNKLFTNPKLLQQIQQSYNKSKYLQNKLQQQKIIRNYDSKKKYQYQQQLEFVQNNKYQKNKNNIYNNNNNNIWKQQLKYSIKLPSVTQITQSQVSNGSYHHLSEEYHKNKIMNQENTIKSKKGTYQPQIDAQILQDLLQIRLH